MKSGSSILTMLPCVETKLSGRNVITAGNVKAMTAEAQKMNMCHAMELFQGFANPRHYFQNQRRVSTIKLVFMFWHNQFFSNFSLVFIGEMSAADTRTFLLSCDGSCNTVIAEVKFTSGDVDIFSKEDEPFNMTVTNWFKRT